MLKTIFFKELYKNIFSNSFLQELIVYDLGNDKKTANLRQAGDIFVAREFPELLSCPHDALFVPDTYLYDGMTEKVKKTNCCVPIKNLFTTLKSTKELTLLAKIESCNK